MHLWACAYGGIEPSMKSKIFHAILQEYNFVYKVVPEGTRSARSWRHCHVIFINNIIIKFSLCVVHVFYSKDQNLFKYKRFKGGRCRYQNAGSNHLRCYYYLGVAQIEWSTRLVLTQKCNRHAMGMSKCRGSQLAGRGCGCGCGCG